MKPDNAATRDHNKAEGEKAARRALHFASRAARLFSEADCPRFAAKAMEAAALISEVAK